MRVSTVALICVVACANAATLRGNTTQAAPESGIFTSYYATVKEGRGVWKWNNALVSYDQNFARFKGQKDLAGAEVGVQSGGSLVMWRKVLGEQTAVHGLDINPRCAAFSDSNTTITLGDQENPKMWSSFFTEVTPKLDFLVDDGGHFAGQMLQTSYAVWPNIKPGGIFVIEDIHGAHYLEPFFRPASQFFGTQSDVAAVHLYSYMLLVDKVGGKVEPYDPSMAEGVVISSVTSLENLMPTIKSAPKGSVVVLQNKAWGKFIQPDGLFNFFQEFIGLYQPVSMPDDPPGCADSPAAVCVYGTVNSPEQSALYSAHILPTKLVVQIPKEPVVIEAVRHGKEWVKTPTDNEIPDEVKQVVAGTAPKAAIHYIKK